MSLPVVEKDQLQGAHHLGDPRAGERMAKFDRASRHTLAICPLYSRGSPVACLMLEEYIRILREGLLTLSLMLCVATAGILPVRATRLGIT